MGFTEKSDFEGGRGGGVHKKPIYRGDCLKRGELGQFADLRELGKKEEGSVFEEELIPQCTLCHPMLITAFVISVFGPELTGRDWISTPN